MKRIIKMENILKEFNKINLNDIECLKKLSYSLFEFSNNGAQSLPLIETSKDFYESINSIIEELEYDIDNNTKTNLTEELKELDNCKRKFKSSLSYLKSIL